MEESPGQPARLCSAKFERATQATILCRKRLWRKSFEHPTSRAFPAPSARPQAGIPFGMGSLLHRVSIEVRRSVGPPHWTALAQFSLDDIDRAMRRRFFDLVASEFGGANRAARLHQLPHQGGLFRRLKVRIGHSPKLAADHEIPAIRRDRVLRLGLERGLALSNRMGHWMRMISASPAPAATTSPTRFPNLARASGETCEIEPCAGSASSSPTIRKVCSRPSSRTIVTRLPNRTSECSSGAGTTRAVARRAVQ